jgi:hypothetical protein
VLKAREPVEALVARAVQIAPAVAMLRKTSTDRTNAKTDLAALEAWCAAVLIRAEGEAPPNKRTMKRGRLAARALAKLSTLPDGPAQAKEFLKGLGVVLSPAGQPVGAAVPQDCDSRVTAMLRFAPEVEWNVRSESWLWTSTAHLRFVRAIGERHG